MDLLRLIRKTADELQSKSFALSNFAGRSLVLSFLQTQRKSRYREAEWPVQGVP